MTVLYLVYSSDGVGASPIMIMKATMTVVMNANALLQVNYIQGWRGQTCMNEFRLHKFLLLPSMCAGCFNLLYIASPAMEINKPYLFLANGTSESSYC